MFNLNNRTIEDSAAPACADQAGDSGMQVAVRMAMANSRDDFNNRTQTFAVRAIQFAKRLEADQTLRPIALQLSRAASSVAANQRAARRARSLKEFVAKLSIVVEEADEACGWCALLEELNLPAPLRPELIWLSTESCELRAMYAKGRATARRRLHGA